MSDAQYELVKSKLKEAARGFAVGTGIAIGGGVSGVAVTMPLLFLQVPYNIARIPGLLAALLVASYLYWRKYLKRGEE